MAGIYGRARSNDLVPNGPIIPLADITLPGTLTLQRGGSNNEPAILNCICTGTFSIGTLALPTTGVAHAAGQEVYLPVNGQTLIYINGSGTFSSTLYTTKANES